MKQLFVYIVIFSIAGFGLYKLFQTPEKYLKKKTEEIIQSSSVKSKKTSMALISKMSKITKWIHHDVQVKAEYEGQIFQARSLNEFRSLLTAYFRQNTTGGLDYKNLTVSLENDRQAGEVAFNAFFNRKTKIVFCKIKINWVKEKRWFIKKIDVHSCKNTD